jgi:hypothetical protein
MVWERQHRRNKEQEITSLGCGAVESVETAIDVVVVAWAFVQQACDFKGNLCGIKLAGRSKCAIMSPCLNLNEFMNTASSSGSFICMILRLIGMIVRKRKHQANESQNNYAQRESTLSPMA